MTWDFARELQRLGPTRSDKPVSLAAAHSYCAWVTRTHYENFSVASVLLPRRLLPHFHSVYAYCRWADDLADETGDNALSLLEWWRGELQHCFRPEGMALSAQGDSPGYASNERPFQGRKQNNADTQGYRPGLIEPSLQDGKQYRSGIVRPTRHPIMVALHKTIRTFDIPSTPFLNLLIAFRQDQIVKDYDTYHQLIDYCIQSANPVGHLVLYLFQCYTPERAILSDKICTGLQLANFWQDLARDYEIGRIYIPKEDRERYNVGNFDVPQFRELIRFEVERTAQLFDEGKALLSMLPREARLPIELFLRGGLAVLDAIRNIDYNVWQRRPTVSKTDKAKLIIKTLLRRPV